ncbi:MAG: CsgG/HfaB family protein [Myxococcaceae bacterium]
MRLPEALALCLLTFPALAQAPKRVAVLYFDNNTKNRDYDVLQKGLADMLVTDLSAVESLQVVEREKLQSLIEELKLQRSRYFDPATAQKLGKIAGAEYAVTGAFAELDPTMRIDVRLIEVLTGKVVFGDKVTGEKGKFFDLQQELVDRFITGLNVKLKASARAKSGVTDMDTLLKYSRGVDAADKGDLKVASATLAEVVRDAPEFKLAQKRYEGLLRRLEEAGKKRSGILNALEEQALKACDTHTAAGWKAAFPPGPPDETELQFNQRQNAHSEPLSMHLGYRAAKANLYFSKLNQRLQGSTNTMMQTTLLDPEARAEVMPLMSAFYAAVQALIADQREILEREPRMNYERLYGRLSDEDAKAFQRLNVNGPQVAWASSLGQQERALAFFALSGKSPERWPGYFTVKPSLAQGDKALVAAALSLLDRAAKHEKADTKNGDVFVTLDVHAEALLGLGRKEEAVARWQQALDAYPTHAKYKEIEKKIKEALCATEECKAFEASVEKCDTNLMMKGAMYMATLTRYERAAGLRRVFETVKSRCPKKDPMYPQSPYNITSVSMVQYVAMHSQGLGDCALFAEAVQWMKDNGGEMQVTVVNTYSGCR